MTAFVANVVVRDDETGFGPIDPLDARVEVRLSLRALHGRVRRRLPRVRLRAAGHAARLAHADGSTRTRSAPLHLGHYLYVYFVLCVPTLFVSGAACFALATIDALDG